MKNIAIKAIMALLIVASVAMGRSNYCTYRDIYKNLVTVSSTWYDGMLVEAEVVSYSPVVTYGVFSTIYEETILLSDGDIILTTSKVTTDGPKTTRRFHPVKMSEKQYKKALVKRGTDKCLNVLFGKRITELQEINP